MRRLGAQPLPGNGLPTARYRRFDERLRSPPRSRPQPRQRGDSVVGTYRLIRRETAARLGGFYSAEEYDISPLIVLIPAKFSNWAALASIPPIASGRPCSCCGAALPPMSFITASSLMFGCASLPGTDPDALAVPLSYLHHYHLAPPGLRPRALAERYVEMCRLDRGAIDPGPALAALPPLDQGISAARRFCRRRRRHRRAIQHHRRLHPGQDRSRDREVFAALRTAVERHMDCLRTMGSPTLRLARLALYFAWTVSLMPVQLVGLAVAPPVDEHVAGLLPPMVLSDSRAFGSG